MIREETCGEFLKKSRLKAGYGLRSFAIAIDMQPSNLSNIEHGRINPPQDPQILKVIAETLGFKKNSKDWRRLFDLAVSHNPQALPADVLEFARKTAGVPVLLRTIEDKKLSKKELEEIAEYIAQQYGRANK